MESNTLKSLCTRGAIVAGYFFIATSLYGGSLAIYKMQNGENPVPFDSSMSLALDQNFSLRAVPSGYNVGSVVFDLDSSCALMGEQPPFCHIENGSPYDSNGEVGANARPWTPPVGNHTLQISVYSQPHGTGSLLTSLSLSISVIANSAAVNPPSSIALTPTGPTASTSYESTGVCPNLPLPAVLYSVSQTSYGCEYSVSSDPSVVKGASIDDDNITIDGSTAVVNGNLPLLHVQPTAGSAVFIVHGANFTLSNFIIDQPGSNKNAILIRNYGNGTTINNITTGALRQVIDSEPMGSGGGNYFTLTNSHLGTTQTVSVYNCMSYSTIKNNIFTGSVGEYELRYDVASNGVTPSYADIENNTFLSDGNSFGKQLFGARQIQNITFENNIVQGVIRVGQQPPTSGKNAMQVTSADQFVGGVSSFSNNTFSQCGPNYAAIEFYQGVTASVNGNLFAPTCNYNQPLQLNAPGSFSISGNIQQELSSNPLNKNLSKIYSYHFPGAASLTPTVNYPTPIASYVVCDAVDAVSGLCQ